MIATQTFHPTFAQLEAFGLGRLNDFDSAEIETHLDSCEICRDIVASLPNDAFANMFRGVSDPGTLADFATDTSHSPESLSGDVSDSWNDLPSTEALNGPSSASLAEHATAESGVRDLPAGLVDHPRYRVLEPLAAGGMGAVYKAEHRVMERLVALKMISARLIENPAAVERFHREVKAAARLSHPNIVTAFDAERVGDTHFLAMEFVEGENLALIVADRGSLSVMLACDYARQVALGLQHAFEYGLVHRDIKPQNLILKRAPSNDSSDEASQGIVKILDFGLSRFVSEVAAVGDSTEFGMVMGTPDYLAPEQARDPHSADIRADIYSLGCTLYFLLTGQPPFPGGTLTEKITAHLERTPPPLSDGRTDVSPELSRVVKRMMAKDPLLRYQTPAEVAEALAPFSGRTTSQTRNRISRVTISALLLLFGLGAYPFRADAYRLATNQGELIVEAHDPDVEVILKRGGKRLVIKDLKTDKKIHLDLSKADRLDLQTGAYVIELSAVNENDARAASEAVEKLQLSANKITLTRGGKKTIEILRELPVERTQRAVQTVGELRRFEGSSSQVSCVVFVGSKRQFLSAGHDMIIRLWDIETGEVVRTFTGHTKAIFALACSPTKPHVLSGSDDDTLRLWDLETGQQLWQHQHEGPVTKVAFFSDGLTAISSASDKTLRVWDVASGKELRRWQHPQRIVHGMAISADGRQLLTGGSDKTVRLWEIETGREIYCLRGHNEFVWSVAFSPDSRYAVSGSPDKTLRFWDFSSSKELYRFPEHPTGIFGVAITPDGRYALSGSGLKVAADGTGDQAGFDNTIRMWDMGTGREVRRFEGHTAGIIDLAISPDGQQMLSASHDATVRLWDLTGSLSTPTPSRAVTAASATVLPPRGRQEPLSKPAVVSTSELRCFEGHQSHIYTVALFSDGRRAVSGGDDGTIRLWETSTGEELRRFQGHKGVVYGVALLPDEQHFVSAGDDQTLRVWNIDSGEVVQRFEGCKSTIRCIAVSPDGHSLFSGSYHFEQQQSDTDYTKAWVRRKDGKPMPDTPLRLWNLATGQETRRLQGETMSIEGVEVTPGVCAAAFSPDGQYILTGHRDHTVRLWDVESGRQLGCFRGHTQLVIAIAFSADGRRAVSAGHSGDGTLRVWDLVERKQLQCIQADSQCVHGAALSSDGRHALTAGRDKIVRLWDLKTGQLLHRFIGHTDQVVSVAFSRNERRALSGSSDGTVRLWELPNIAD